MIRQQLKYINDHNDLIIKKATNIYKIGTSINRMSFINDFLLLEQKAKLYIPIL